MPNYVKALEYAHDEKYELSISQLEKTKREIDSTIGKNTNLHLYVNQRIASLMKI
jgi:hypothetical protein